MLIDKNIINGKIFTMESETAVCEAFSIFDGKIVACGSSEEILKNEAKEVIDLKGKCVLPGFIDSHQHILSYARGLHAVNLRNVTSWKEAKEKLKERAAITPEGQWIKGTSFNHENWDDPTLPHKDELDDISSNHPILISRYCMHVHVANTMALQMAGIVKGFVPTAENSIDLDALEEPTGILWENAVSPILRIIPDPLASFEDKKNAVAEVLKDMNRYGITGAHPIQGKFCDAEEFIGLYQMLNKENRLNVRIYISFDEYPCFDMKTGFGDYKIKYGFYKIYSDGSLGSRAAALYEPYSDMPGMTGVLNYSQAEITEMCQRAYDIDIQIAIHAIGDKGLDIALTAIETVYFKNPKKDVRFRLVHVMCMNEELIRRMKKLPVVLDIQPKFVSSNVRWSEDRLGMERSKYAYPWRRLIDEGFILTGGSDLPVEHYNPFLGIYAITTRKDLNGYPKGGWYPEQRVTAYEAIEMYTKNAAYASFEEHIKGTISNGMLADFIVLDRNPFIIPTDDLKNVIVEKTYLGGEEVFSQN